MHLSRCWNYIQSFVFNVACVCWLCREVVSSNQWDLFLFPDSRCAAVVLFECISYHLIKLLGVIRNEWSLSSGTNSDQVSSKEVWALYKFTLLCSCNYWMCRQQSLYFDAECIFDQWPFTAEGCIPLNLKLPYHPWCLGQFSPLSPIYCTISHFNVETNSMNKIHFCFNKIWVYHATLWYCRIVIDCLQLAAQWSIIMLLLAQTK